MMGFTPCDGEDVELLYDLRAPACIWGGVDQMESTASEVRLHALFIEISGGNVADAESAARSSGGGWAEGLCSAVDEGMGVCQAHAAAKRCCAVNSNV